MHTSYTPPPPPPTGAQSAWGTACQLLDRQRTARDHSKYMPHPLQCTTPPPSAILPHPPPPPVSSTAPPPAALLHPLQQHCPTSSSTAPPPSAALLHPLQQHCPTPSSTAPPPSAALPHPLSPTGCDPCVHVRSPLQKECLLQHSSRAANEPGQLGRNALTLHAHV